MNPNVAAYLAYYRKAILNVLGLLLTVGTYILSTNTLPDKYAGMLTTGVGAVAALIHVLTANAQAPGTAEAIEDSNFSEDVDEDLPTFSDEELQTAVHDVDESPTPSVSEILETAGGKHEAV